MYAEVVGIARKTKGGRKYADQKCAGRKHVESAGFACTEKVIRGLRRPAFAGTPLPSFPVTLPHLYGTFVGNPQSHPPTSPVPVERVPIPQPPSAPIGLHQPPRLHHDTARAIRRLKMKASTSQASGWLQWAKRCGWIP